jgi:hypothetical protein
MVARLRTVSSLSRSGRSALRPPTRCRSLMTAGSGSESPSASGEASNSRHSSLGYGGRGVCSPRSQRPTMVAFTPGGRSPNARASSTSLWATSSSDQARRSRCARSRSLGRRRFGAEAERTISRFQPSATVAGLPALYDLPPTLGGIGV